MAVVNLFDHGHALRVTRALEPVYVDRSSQSKNNSATFWIKGVAVIGSKPAYDGKIIDTYYIHEKTTLDLSTFLTESHAKVRSEYPTKILSLCSAAHASYVPDPSGVDARPRRESGANTVQFEERLGILSPDSFFLFGAKPALKDGDVYGLNINETVPLPHTETIALFNEPQEFPIQPSHSSRSAMSLMAFNKGIAFQTTLPHVTVDRNLWGNGTLSTPLTGNVTLNHLYVIHVRRASFSTKVEPPKFMNGLSVQTSGTRVDPRFAGDKAHHETSQLYSTYFEWNFDGVQVR